MRSGPGRTRRSIEAIAALALKDANGGSAQESKPRHPSGGVSVAARGGWQTAAVPDDWCRDQTRPSPAEAKKPGRTEEEFGGYMWDLDNNRKKGEEPVKDNDHGMDAMRYMVAHLDVVPKKKLRIWA